MDRRLLPHPLLSVRGLLLMFVLFGSFPFETCGTITNTSCRRRRIVHTINYQNCITKRLLSYACQGLCPSYSRISPDPPNALERSCNCCQNMNQQMRSVAIWCPNPGGPRHFKRVVMRIMLPQSCMCRPCFAPLQIESDEFVNFDFAWYRKNTNNCSWWIQFLIFCHLETGTCILPSVCIAITIWLNEKKWRHV